MVHKAAKSVLNIGWYEEIDGETTEAVVQYLYDNTKAQIPALFYTQMERKVDSLKKG